MEQLSSTDLAINEMRDIVIASKKEMDRSEGKAQDRLEP